jgi:uncharacterized protein (UPF0218 family)
MKKQPENDDVIVLDAKTRKTSSTSNNKISGGKKMKVTNPLGLTIGISVILVLLTLFCCGILCFVSALNS